MFFIPLFNQQPALAVRSHHRCAGVDDLFTQFYLPEGAAADNFECVCLIPVLEKGNFEILPVVVNQRTVLMFRLLMKGYLVQADHTHQGYIIEKIMDHSDKWRVDPGFFPGCKSKWNLPAHRMHA